MSTKTPPVKMDIEKRVMEWWLAGHSATITPKPPGPFPGPLLHFWDRYAKQARELIEEFHLLSTQELAAELRPQPEWKELVEVLLEWNSKFGGNRGPHLHYDGKVFPLTQTEWNAFAKSALNMVHQKLDAHPGAVGFEDFCTAMYMLTPAERR